MNLNYRTGAETPIRAISQDTSSQEGCGFDGGQPCGAEPLVLKHWSPFGFPEQGVTS